MKLLTKHTDYAVRALLVLAKKRGEFISAREIAEAQNMPYQFVRRILQQLIRHKLVVSKEGTGGGFRLNTSPEKISTVDIIRIFQGKVQLSECMFRKRLCRRRRNCALRKQIKRIERIVSKEFENITIGRLAESTS
ncbi:MAG: Rrf2 family transcriptional regulator [Candidatus Omnitrophica bacterium]|nr:Rrf2 family transcriptional regulator [Candidatus Omnitrophota bacterium]MBD3268839.1 Rrf2 family transcriptional regulator [Candidatus Omnitrophota bacterium]